MPKRQLLKVNQQKEKHAPLVRAHTVPPLNALPLNVHALEGPETADEYLAGVHACSRFRPSFGADVAIAGVEAEEAGEKWRAGDAAKSSRFFVRAVELYDAGLERFPHSFDLSYNKARLQYDISQQPRLLAQLPVSTIGLLELALESHRSALKLKQDDADVLFNTAQVLTSLGELRGEGSSTYSPEREDALKKFQEAIELFQRCFAVQEYQLNEAQAMMTDAPMPDSLADEASDHPTTEELGSQFPGEEQWASIIEPITTNALLDTTVAQIETLTVMCGLMISQDPAGVPWLEEYSRPLLQRATSLVEGTDRVQEVSLSMANFKCAFADTAFRTGRLDLTTYQEEINNAFGTDIDPSNSVQWLCDRADAYIALTASIRPTTEFASHTEAVSSQLNDIQWKYLTKALADLTAATKLSNVPNLAKIHLRRGDCELLRYCLGKSPSCYKQAIQNTTMLLRNAEIYYRGAAKFAKVEKAGQEEAEALTKEAVVSSLSGDDAKLKTYSARVMETIDEMRDEGLLVAEDIDRLGQRLK
ncbi:hypothetical protein MMC27_006747 [Xylographa pallens]|nr:hypothetical protein [Xylographa pallens]